MLFGGRAPRSGLFAHERVGWIVRGIVFQGLWADLPGVNCGKEMRPMSAEILKRKLRNFPVASLSERIATA